MPLTNQNRFRLFNPSSTPTSGTTTTTTSTTDGPSTLLRPLHRLQQQAEHPTHQSIHQTQETTTVTNHVERSTVSSPKNEQTDSSQQQKSSVLTATRIPASGLSRLARPTPLQQIGTASPSNKTFQRPASGIASIRTVTGPTQQQYGSSIQLKPSVCSTVLKAPPPQSLGGSHSKLAASSQLRPRTSTMIKPKTATQAISSTTIEKLPKTSLARVRLALPATPSVAPPPITSAESRFRTQTISSSTFARTSPSTQSSRLSQAALVSAAGQPATYLVDMTSVEQDVGQIRKMLEQLLKLLQVAHQDQEEKEHENERLRQEVRELKSKIRSIRSTVAANADSEPPTPVVPQQVLHHQRQYDSRDRTNDSPPSDSDTRNDAFSRGHYADHHDEETIEERNYQTVETTVVDGAAGEQRPSSNQRPPSSVYLSPLI